MAKHLARFASLVLVALLALLPLATVFAASPAQEINEDLVGVYESDLLESADAPDGLVITVSLFDDGSMEALSDYQNGTLILEVGTWYDNGDDTITLVVEGTVDEAYDSPTELVFEVDGDTLTNADLTSFGKDGLVLTATGDEPESLVESMAGEAAAEDAGAVEDAAASEDTAEDSTGEDAGADTTGDEQAGDEDMSDVEDIPGLYISNEIDADGSPAGVMLYLNEDGSAETVAMNFTVGDIFPISRTGAWEEDEEGNVTITLEAELVPGEDGAATSEDLEEPESLTFTNTEGLLQNELFTFFPVDVLEFLVRDMEAAASEEGASDDAAAEDAATDDAVAGDAKTDDAKTGDAKTDDASADETSADESVTMYMTPMQQILKGNVVVLLLMENGIASLSAELKGADPVVDVGSWEAGDDGTITVTMTSDADGNEYDEPFVLVFEQVDDLTLAGVDYDVDRYGKDLVLEATPEE